MLIHSFIHSFIHSLIVHSFNHSFIWLHCLTGILYEALECVTTCEAVHMTSGAECRQRRAAYSACFTPAAMSNYYSVFNQVTLTPGSHSHPAHVLLLYTEVTLTPSSCVTTLHWDHTHIRLMYYYFTLRSHSHLAHVVLAVMTIT